MGVIDVAEKMRERERIDYMNKQYVYIGNGVNAVWVLRPNVRDLQCLQEVLKKVKLLPYCRYADSLESIAQYSEYDWSFCDCSVEYDSKDFITSTVGVGYIKETRKLFTQTLTSPNEYDIWDSLEEALCDYGIFITED